MIYIGKNIFSCRRRCFAEFAGRFKKNETG